MVLNIKICNSKLSSKMFIKIKARSENAYASEFSEVSNL